MTKQQQNKVSFLLFSAVAVLVIGFITFAQPSAATCLRYKNTPSQNLDKAGAEMIWESLTHQFVSNIKK